MSNSTVQTVTIGEICAADLRKASVDELRVFADVLGIENAHGLKKRELQAAVSEARDGIEANAAVLATDGVLSDEMDDGSGNNPEGDALVGLLPEVADAPDANDLPLTRGEIDHAAANADWDSALKGSDGVHGYLCVPIEGGYLLKPVTYIGPVRAVRELPRP